MRTIVDVRAELLKLATTRAPWMLAAVAVLVTAALAVQPTVGAGRNGAPSIGTAGAALAVLDAMGRGALVALILGVLVTASEFRHRTVTPTLLQSPSRFPLALAKGVTAVTVGLGLGVVCAAVVAAAGTVSGAWQGTPGNGDITLRALGLVLTYPLYALLGAGTGALLGRNQPVAMVLPVVWLLGLEALALSSLPPCALAWSVGGTTDALQNAGNVPFVLPVWVGAGCLLGYGLLLALAGALRLHRSDII